MQKREWKWKAPFHRHIYLPSPWCIFHSVFIPFHFIHTYFFLSCSMSFRSNSIYKLNNHKILWSMALKYNIKNQNMCLYVRNNFLLVTSKFHLFIECEEGHSVFRCYVALIFPSLFSATINVYYFRFGVDVCVPKSPTQRQTQYCLQSTKISLNKTENVLLFFSTFPTLNGGTEFMLCDKHSKIHFTRWGHCYTDTVT